MLKKMDSLLVPNDFVHGFMTFKNDTLVSYKVDNYYNKESEGSINWKDEVFQGIWPEFESIFYQKKMKKPHL